MFTITPTAAQQVIVASQQHGIENPSLRIAARRSMDGSIEYGMGFDDERDGDIQLQSEGINLLIAEQSEPLLKGATLDFVEMAPGQAQFIFINPNDTTPRMSGGGCGGGGCGGGSCGSGGRGGCG